jgi:flagellar hook assembly protein FlgD
LAKATTISLSIHDIHGNTIRHIDLNHLKAGIYESKDRAIYWDGRNKSGEYAASGVYFYTLRAGNIRATQKMILMK